MLFQERADEHVLQTTCSIEIALQRGMSIKRSLMTSLRIKGFLKTYFTLYLLFFTLTFVHT